MYPPATGFEYVNLPFPTDLPESTAEETLREYDGKLVNKARTYYLFQTPLAKTADWSSALWGLEMLLFESGMSREEVFIVAEASVVNKYARDDRPRERLWMDVCKAFAKNESNSNIIIPVYDENKPILTEEEVAFVESHPGFVERYIEWASKMGDAAVQYHQAGAFVLLSTLLAGNVKLPTSFGTIKPNVWFMLLADTTLTRKSTAMDLAMDLITEVDPDAILATDGSIEGLITSLATRPSRPSIFLRDEFAGLLESMTKKEYMAGMSEQLTKLYDGKMMKRVLRKEQIEVKDPCLILFAGGIRTRICALLTFEQITSGFIPRFIFITAESDVSKLRPLGPPSIRSLGNRQEILDELKGLQQHYGVREIRVVASQVTEIKPNEIEASLTPDAWDRYNAAETGMVAAAAHHQMAEYLTPVYDRLAKTGLKTAILLAAARQRTSTVIVEMEDVIHALYYVEGWRTYVQQIINNVGKTTNERQLDLISMAITKKPGVSRSTLMQNYHLEARIAEQIFATLEQRGLITRERLGRGEVFHPIQVKVGV